MNNFLKASILASTMYGTQVWAESPKVIDEEVNTNKSEVSEIISNDSNDNCPIKYKWKCSTFDEFNENIWNNEKTQLVIEFKWENHDLTTFNKKVLIPVWELIWNDFDINNLLKIAITENSGSTHSSEVKHVLRLLTEDNYISKLNTKSKAWAGWLFQVMPNTANYLNSLYDIEKLLSENKKYLEEKFDIKTQKDFDTLKNALYAAFYLKHSENYLKSKWIKPTDENLAKLYNWWPIALTRMVAETRNYLKKFKFADKILKINWIS